jgi:hypothetical protein
LYSAKQFFDWFTGEVINSEEIYNNDVFATCRVKDKIWELAKSVEVDCILDYPLDALWIKQEAEVRKILLAFEHESRLKWDEIKKDFTKLVDSKALMKFGVFYIHESTVSKAEETLSNHLKWMREIILSSYLKQNPPEEWLLIIGIHVDTPERIWYQGYTFTENDWHGLGRKSIKE